MKRYPAILAAALFLVGNHANTASAGAAVWIMATAVPPDANGISLYLAGAATVIGVDTSGATPRLKIDGSCAALTVHTVTEIGLACYLVDGDNTAYFFSYGEWEPGSAVSMVSVVNRVTFVPVRTDYQFCFRAGYTRDGSPRGWTIGRTCAPVSV